MVPKGRDGERRDQDEPLLGRLVQRPVGGATPAVSAGGLTPAPPPPTPAAASTPGGASAAASLLSGMGSSLLGYSSVFSETFSSAAGV